MDSGRAVGLPIRIQLEFFCAPKPGWSHRRESRLCSRFRFLVPCWHTRNTVLRALNLPEEFLLAGALVVELAVPDARLMEGAVAGHLQDLHRRTLVGPHVKVLGKGNARCLLVGARRCHVSFSCNRILRLHEQSVPHLDDAVVDHSCAR